MGQRPERSAALTSAPWLHRRRTFFKMKSILALSMLTLLSPRARCNTVRPLESFAVMSTRLGFCRRASMVSSLRSLQAWRRCVVSGVSW